MGALHLTFLEFPRVQYFRGFTPDDSNRVKELNYSLTEGNVSGIESIVGQPYRFRWTLELSGVPYPDGIPFPCPPPLVYYGHREETEPSPT